MLVVVGLFGPASAVAQVQPCDPRSIVLLSRGAARGPVAVQGQPTPPDAGGAEAAPADEVPPAGPAVPMSARLHAQGYDVAAPEAAYLDADEQVTEAYLRPLTMVQVLMATPPSRPCWAEVMTLYLEMLERLDPAWAPVPPPADLQGVHAAAVAYRAHLGAAARAWLGGVRADDPAWLTRGQADYAAAERARRAWYAALWEHYAGEPPPGP